MSDGIEIEFNLQAERSALGMTQAELGARVGVSQKTISLWGRILKPNLMKFS